MKKPVFYILLGLSLCLSFQFPLTAQENLVPNGSFEEYSVCPVSNDLGNDQLELALGWWKPTLGTSDYFNRCSNSLSGVVGVPNNFWGYQEAMHGDAYAGFVAIEVSPIGTYKANEYIRTALSEPLKPFTQYEVVFYVSLANYSSVGHSKLGVLFTEYDDFLNSQYAIDTTPQLVHAGPIIIDTTNWTRLAFVYTASGCEKFMTIGYFSPTMENDTIQIAPTNFGYYAYYYVDSISVVELEGSPGFLCGDIIGEFPNVFTPNGDNVNDVIDISGQTHYIESVEIINRWGNVLAFLDHNNPIWDGSNAQDGVYFYRLKYKNWKDIQTGFIHLVR